MNLLSIRDALRKGVLRNVFSALASLAAFLIPQYISLDPEKLSMTANTIAPIVFLLGVVAFNLRSKLSDFALKSIEIGLLGRINIKGIRNTGKKITNLSLLSFIAAVMVAIIAILSPIEYSNYCYSIIFLTFAFCCIQYIYACFAYEELEDQIMTNFALSKLSP